MNYEGLDIRKIGKVQRKDGMEDFLPVAEVEKFLALLRLNFSGSRARVLCPFWGKESIPIYARRLAGSEVV